MFINVNKIVTTRERVCRSYMPHKSVSQVLNKLSTKTNDSRSSSVDCVSVSRLLPDLREKHLIGHVHNTRYLKLKA